MSAFEEIERFEKVGVAIDNSHNRSSCLLITVLGEVAIAQERPWRQHEEEKCEEARFTGGCCQSKDLPPFPLMI